MSSCSNDCASGCGTTSASCGSACGISAKPALADWPEVAQAAQALAGLLADTSEFQALARWSRAVRLDPQVTALVDALQEQAYRYDPSAAQAVVETASLEEQIEAQPVVRSFRGAEVHARGLFCAVDQAISQTAGLQFAQYAKPSSHG